MLKPKAVIVDIDGTIADNAHRQHFINKKPKDWDGFFAGMEGDEPKSMVLEAVDYFATQYVILFLTGRPERYRGLTSFWLIRHVKNIQPSMQLFMRPDGDFTSDSSMKKALFIDKISPGFDVKLVIDDRTSVVNMWRELGLECWQVADGDF